jgi:hypothetical protein
MNTMIKRIAIRFGRLGNLAYFFKLRNRTYVCPRHRHSFIYVGTRQVENATTLE